MKYTKRIKKNDLINAMKLYREKSINEALNKFKDISTVFNDRDNISKIYIKRCENLLQNGIPVEWAGIEKLENK